MMIHDVFDDVEAETDLGRAVFPFFSSLIKAGPDLGKLRFRKPRTVVIYGEIKAVFCGRKAQSDGTPRFRVTGGVHHIVIDGLFDLKRIQVSHAVLLNGGREMDLHGRQPAFVLWSELLQKIRKAGPAKGSLLDPVFHPGILEDGTDKKTHLVDLVQNGRKIVILFGLVILILQKLHLTGDDGQRRFQFMCDVAHQFFPHVLKLGHIPVLPEQKIIVVVQVIDVLLDLALHEIDLVGKLPQFVKEALFRKTLGKVILHHALDQLADPGQRPCDPFGKEQGKKGAEENGQQEQITQYLSGIADAAVEHPGIFINQDIKKMLILTDQAAKRNGLAAFLRIVSSRGIFRIECCLLADLIRNDGIAAFRAGSIDQLKITVADVDDRKGIFQRKKGFFVFISQVVEIQAPDKGKSVVDLSFFAEQIIILCKKTVEKQGPAKEQNQKEVNEKEDLSTQFTHSSPQNDNRHHR